MKLRELKRQKLAKAEFLAVGEAWKATSDLLQV